jgi:5-methyltetrahydrofolate--homocysteine methyltransferase
VNDSAYDTDLLDALSKRVLVGEHLNNVDGCNEIRNETRQDFLEQIHRNFFEPGADVVEAKYVRLQSG